MSTEELRSSLAALTGYGQESRTVAAFAEVATRYAREMAAEEVRTVRRWLLETGRADADTLQQLRARVDQIAGTDR